MDDLSVASQLRDWRDALRNTSGRVVLTEIEALNLANVISLAAHRLAGKEEW